MQKCFSPPYSKTVKTNKGKIFLKLIRNHFAASEKMSKIFNKNNVKVSDCCGGGEKKKESIALIEHCPLILMLKKANLGVIVE